MIKSSRNVNVITLVAASMGLALTLVETSTGSIHRGDGSSAVTTLTQVGKYLKDSILDEERRADEVETIIKDIEKLRVLALKAGMSTPPPVRSINELMAASRNRIKALVADEESVQTLLVYARLYESERFGRNASPADLSTTKVTLASETTGTSATSAAPKDYLEMRSLMNSIGSRLKNLDTSVSAAGVESDDESYGEEDFIGCGNPECGNCAEGSIDGFPLEFTSGNLPKGMPQGLKDLLAQIDPTGERNIRVVALPPGTAPESLMEMFGAGENVTKH